MTRTLRVGSCSLLLFVMLLPGLSLAVADAPVADAAMRRDAEGARRLLADGADVNAAQGDGMTALHWAAMYDDAGLAQVLLYAGARTTAATRLGGYTPLLVAARHGSAAVIEVLLEAGASPTGATANGTTPLMFAAASGNAAAVRALLAAGAEPDAVESVQGQTALMFAAAEGRVDAIDALIAGGADPDRPSAVIDIVAKESAMRDAYRRRARLAAAAREIDAPPTPPEADSDAEATEDEAQEAAAVDEDPPAVEDDPELAADLELSGSSPAVVSTGAEGEGTATAVVDPELAADPELSATDPQVVAAQTSGAAADSETASDDADEDADAEPAEPDAEEGSEEDPPRPLSYGQLVGAVGGLTALHHAARQGHVESVQALVELGADVNRPSGGDHTTPLLIATLNGHFDVAMLLLEQGADPNVASEAGATPLYAAINVQWAPHAFYPQPSPAQQRTTHLELMETLLAAGADPDVRLEKKLWYTGYNFDQDGVDAQGATAFWRAAQSADLEALKLLVAYGADPTITTSVAPRRRLPNGRNADADLEADPPKVGDPAVDALQAAAGAGYDGNFHRTHPSGRMPAVRYLVEELGFDVNRADDEGYTPVHNAAARGDNEMILFLVEHGADVTAVSRAGETTADMANGPVQRIQPFPETIALLESLGSENNDNCVSC